MTETQRVYRLLKTELLDGTFKPGTVLRQVDIAERTGASRTPVREAIIMLAADRLVRIDAGHGASVREIPVREFVEINQVRELLEGAAARAAAKRIPDAEIAKLRARYDEIAGQEPIDPADIVELDQLIHLTLAAHCGNSQMQRLIEEFNDLNTLARHRDVSARDAETVRSLGDLLAALEARDADAIEELMRTHIQEFAALLPALLQDY